MPTIQTPSSITLPSQVARGVCYAHNWQEGGSKGYGTPTSEESLDYLVGLGTTHVSLTPFGWMKSLDTSVIGGEHLSKQNMPRGAETRARMEGVIGQAKAKGLRVMLKPHIWVSGGKWRGEINPKDWPLWWKNYEVFMLYWTKLAQEHQLESLVVGVELVKAIKDHPEAFLDVIARVREVYKGKLTYSANWDEEVGDQVWGALDAVGVQFYPPLTKEEGIPKLAVMEESIAKHLMVWQERSRRVKRPLWITEVGYKSAPTALTEPFGWPERLPSALRKQDEVIQQRAYQALFAQLSRSPEVEAVYLWKVFTDKETDEEGKFGFSPRGKLAEETLSKAFRTP